MRTGRLLRGCNCWIDGVHEMASFDCAYHNRNRVFTQFYLMVFACLVEAALALSSRLLIVVEI